MAINTIRPVFETFKDIDGDPLDGGQLYIGQPDIDAEASSKAVYWDETLLSLAVQPITIKGGYAMNGDEPGNLYLDGDYSMKLKNMRGTTVHEKLRARNRVGIDIATYETRADAVTAIAVGELAWLPEGGTLMAGGLSYIKQDGATSISDMGNFLPKGDVYPEHFGDTDGVDDNDLITAASEYVSGLGGGVVRLMAKAYVGPGRAVEATTPNVWWIGEGPEATSYTITAYNNAIWPLSDDCGIFGVKVDGGGLQTEAAGKGSVIRYANRCIVRDTVAQNGYTPYGPGGEVSDSLFYDIRSKDCESRGWQADHNCHRNKVFGIDVENCGKAVLKIGHNASYNQVFGLTASGCNGTDGVSIWIDQGAHDNIVSGFSLRDPADPTAPAIQFDAHSYNNTVEDGRIEGHTRVVEFDGLATSGIFPDVTDGNTSRNTVKNLIAKGVSNSPTPGQEGFYYAVNFSSDGTYDASGNTVSDCYFETFYGVFKNGDGAGSNTGCNGSTLKDIRSADIGAGGIMKAMYSATDRIFIKRVQGFPLSATVSASIAVDSTGLKTTALTAHGLGWTPPLSDCTARLIRDTSVGDYRFDTLHVVTSTATSVQARCDVTTASATGGATAFLNVDIHHREDVTFPLSQVTP